MAYTAIEKMRRKNLEIYGFDVGPMQPDMRDAVGYDLKGAAMRFLHERCEGLLFSEEITKKEADAGVFYGKSLKAGQIPYNMEMDINRLCLARTLASFIDSGNMDDAYTVYYCYFEMLLRPYGKSKKSLDLLSEFESNASSLLMKHRDHYSHSVYVFTLGLAIYETNDHFRKAFKAFYHFSTDENDVEADHQAAHKFLELWGMTGLFHDIGYPFELPFEQVMSYFEIAGLMRGHDNPSLVYRNMKPMLAFSDEEKRHFKRIYGRLFSNLEQLFAFVITKYLGEDYDLSEAYLSDVLHRKSTNPEDFGFHIDHAYFSAMRLYRELVNSPVRSAAIGAEQVDALAAILLHNSLFKFAIANFKAANPELHKAPLKMETFPLAYLLFLCDELQCWDRMAYGRNTRLEMHPHSADMDFSSNALQITYNFDIDEQEKVYSYMSAYREWEASGKTEKPPRLKEYSDMAAKEQRFARDIELIVDTSNIPLTVSAGLKRPDRRSKRIYLSSSSFLHLCDFAAALNARYSYNGEESLVPQQQIEEEFESLSLEYQLSNLDQAKNFAKFLNAVDCFYTDRPVDFDLLTSFTSDQAEIIAPMEHERWLREKKSMGWHPGDAYKKIPAEMVPFAASCDERNMRKMLREQFRMHELALSGDFSAEEARQHYLALPEAEQQKDIQPFNSMLKLIKKFDGLRIYQLSK